MPEGPRIPHIEERVGLATFLRPFRLLGCPRRNVWTQPRRSDVGAAVLAHVGVRASVSWEGEVVDFFTIDQDLLLWRPGPWRSWWIDDAYLFCGMIRAQSNIRASGAYVLHEVDGATKVRYVSCPAEATAARYAEAQAAWEQGRTSDTPPRLDRRTERAKHVCYRCPVRRRCEALDLETGYIHDFAF